MDNYYLIPLWLGSISLACIGVILAGLTIWGFHQLEHLYNLIKNYAHRFDVNYTRIIDYVDYLQTYSKSIDYTLGQLADSRETVALESIKDTFLSRKDNEGLMLLEAVQKQLKKRKKKNEVANNSTAV